MYTRLITPYTSLPTRQRWQCLSAQMRLYSLNDEGHVVFRTLLLTVTRNKEQATVVKRDGDRASSTHLRDCFAPEGYQSIFDSAPSVL